MGHVHQQVGAHGVGDIAEALPVHHPGVGGKAGDDQLGPVLLGQTLDLRVVNLPGGRVQTVLIGPVQLAGKVGLGAVGQVTAMGQAHAQHHIARFTEGHVDGGVGLGAGVGLDIGEVGAEQGLGAVDGQLLGDIDVLATAVITLAGIALGVLVGEHRTLGLHHPGAGVVLRGDELDVLFLAAFLVLDRRPELVVIALDAGGLVKHGVASSGEIGAFYPLWPAACAPSWSLAGGRQA